MNILVRKYHQNQDKSNIWVNTRQEALKSLGRTEEQIEFEINWLNYTDLFFKGTNNYIRIKNS